MRCAVFCRPYHWGLKVALSDSEGGEDGRTCEHRESKGAHILWLPTRSRLAVRRQPSPPISLNPKAPNTLCHSKLGALKTVTVIKGPSNLHHGNQAPIALVMVN